MQIVTEDNWKKGDKVVKGPDWSWGNQAENAEYGIILECSEDGWVRVEWQNPHKHTNSYRVGAEDAFDLYFYNQESSFKFML